MSVDLSIKQLTFLKEHEKEIAEAEIIFLVGSSHSGKSTMSKAIQSLFGKILVPEKIVSYPLVFTKKYTTREDYYKSPERIERWKLMVKALDLDSSIGCVSEGWVPPEAMAELRAKHKTLTIGIKVTKEQLEKRAQKRGDKNPEKYLFQSFEYIERDWDKFKIDIVFEATDDAILKLSADDPKDVKTFWSIWDEKKEQVETKPNAEKVEKEIVPDKPEQKPADTEASKDSKEPASPMDTLKLEKGDLADTSQEANRERKAQDQDMICPKCKKPMLKHYHSPKLGTQVICHPGCSGRTDKQFEEDWNAQPEKFRAKDPDKVSSQWPKDTPWPGAAEEETGQDDKVILDDTITKGLPGDKLGEVKEESNLPWRKKRSLKTW